MNLTISQKGLVLVAVPLVFQLAFGVAVGLYRRSHADAERWAAHTKDVISLVQTVHTSVTESHAAIRGAVIARDPSFAGPHHEVVRSLPDRWRALDALLADNPDQFVRARAMRGAAETVLNRHAEQFRLLAAGSHDEATALVRAGAGREAMAAFRAALGDFQAEEARLDADREALAERAGRRLNAVIVGGGLLSAGCTLAVMYAFRRGIVRRFAAVEEAARRLAAGDAPPPPLAGADEPARLDRTFRDMAAALRESADRVHDLYDNAPCGYHSVGPDGTVLAINRTELRWLGYDEAEVVGRMRFAEFVRPSLRESYRDAFARLREDGEVGDVELELIRKDGTTFPVLAHSSSVRDDAGRYLRSRTTLTDLTERKKAESAVRRFADLAHNIPLGLLIYQLDEDPAVLRVRSANREAHRLLDVPLDDAVGRPVAEVFPAIPPDQIRRYSAVAATGVGDNLGEFQYGDARVAERWWSVLAFPLPDRSVGVAFHDVTSRVRAEGEVRHLNGELEERVRRRTAELESANRDLAQKNAENEMFVYSVSHDLRSPLVNLQGFSRELEKACRGLSDVLAGETVPPDVRDRGRTLLDGKAAKAIGFIQAAVLRLAGIIDALLRLSRVGRVEYRWEVVDVAGVVARVTAAAQGSVAERNADVRVGGLPPAWGDRAAVEQAFGNLIVNALTYLDPARAGVIEVGCLDGEDVGSRTYFVRDNGLGLAEGHRAKIFQAFQRAHPEVGPGEGLGLAIVARVAERHHGRVWVESTPGEGSTFYLTLPAPPGGA